MIHMTLPFLPPTMNHAYVNVAGGRALSKDGKAFKKSATEYLGLKYGRLSRGLSENRPYTVLFLYYFERLENETWPKSTKHRYKKLDASNRIKLLEDSLKDALGIDDSSTMIVLASKQQGLPERTEIYLWDNEQEESPLDVFIRKLVSS